MLPLASLLLPFSLQSTAFLLLKLKNLFENLEKYGAKPYNEIGCQKRRITWLQAQNNDSQILCIKNDIQTLNFTSMKPRLQSVSSWGTLPSLFLGIPKDSYGFLRIPKQEKSL
jgi:hypothetical protein